MTQGLLMGLTIAFGVQPALTVVGQHFNERRAFAMGLVSTGSALGGIGFPLMFDHLLPIVGFSNSLRLAAVKIAYVTVPASVVHRLTRQAFAIRSPCASLQASPVANRIAKLSARLSISKDTLTDAMLYYALEHGLLSWVFGSLHTISNYMQTLHMLVTRSATTSCAY
jgi:MFS family permease